MDLDNIYISTLSTLSTLSALSTLSTLSALSEDIINIILSYDKHFIIRKGRPINIIPKDDIRYKLLQQRSIILQKITPVEIYNKYYGEVVLKNDLGIETRIAVYEYPMLDKCIWSLYNYYPNMMISLNVQTVHF